MTSTKALVTKSRILGLISMVGKTNTGRLGGMMVVFIIFIAVSAPFLPLHSPIDQNLNDKLSPPSARYLLGTDDLGRDVLSRVIYGSRISLVVALAAVAIAIAIGVPLGLLAGYYGGTVSMAIETLVNIFWSFPTIILSLAFVAAFGPGLENLVIAIGVAYWAAYARLVRGEVLSLRERKFIEASRALGGSSFRIMFHHVLPNCLTPLLVWAMLDVPTVILTEAALTFIGMGVQPPTPSWGAITSSGRNYIVQAPWIVTFPGIMIVLTVVSLSMLGDAIRDVLDPRLQWKVR